MTALHNDSAGSDIEFSQEVKSEAMASRQRQLLEDVTKCFGRSHSRAKGNQGIKSAVGSVPSHPRSSLVMGKQYGDNGVWSTCLRGRSSSRSHDRGHIKYKNRYAISMEPIHILVQNSNFQFHRVSFSKPCMDFDTLRKSDYGLVAELRDLGTPSVQGRI